MSQIKTLNSWVLSAAAPIMWNKQHNADNLLKILNLFTRIIYLKLSKHPIMGSFIPFV